MAPLRDFYHGLFRQRDLITRKFYLVILLFVAIVFCLVLLDHFQTHIINSVRAYVAGEGFWSKGQKDAVYHLQHYAGTHDKDAYAKYMEGLSASLGDRKARVALQADPPDIERARLGFLEGRNHPDDIDNMITLFTRFGEVSFMKKAINIWSEGDLLIDKLMRQGDALDAEIGSKNPDTVRIRAIMDRVATLNHQLSELEDRFSATLGDAARKIKQLTEWIMAIATLLLLTIGVILSRQILHGLRETQNEMQQLEEHLRESQKMEAVGTLVGGIAHDFNNTLAAMQGNLFLAEKSLDDRDKIAKRIQSLKRLSNHSADIVRQLQAFANKDIVEMQPMSLNTFFMELKKRVPSLIPENIVFHMQLCDETLWIEADTPQLHETMIHLLSNARDAVGQSRSPVIDCLLTRYDPDDAFAEKHPALADRSLAHVIIRDNGCGIPNEDLKHVFEPFYTTKEVGKGTGLGLSMVYGATQRHRGVVTVQSEPDQGTSVHLYLPVTEVVMPAPVEPLPQQKSTAHKPLTILLVDDDINIRTICTEVLRDMGYEIVMADDGMAALEQYNQYGKQIDIVITDILMPDMGGSELSRQLRRHNSRLPVIFISGHDPAQMNIPANLKENSAILTKPFTMDVLTDTIQSLQEHST